ncbi:MAG: fibronectin/fibrinogen-binding protein [Spirulinaceae cyanobacterium RM2_2_10]|nr:fibronectin/fibrinogen-binding protein [Spirulinaceae cyanobacterium SM2_1_0]NJO19334.1 fibronectin/fibrinogen-binding protein [Spirulinaceae cyanobacterium RM2_2_10]
MQPVDFTTLAAVTAELRAAWLPARVEQVVQRDRHTICIALRTLSQRGWLTIAWHPQAARLGIAPPPPRSPDPYSFSDQLRRQLGGLALIAITPLTPWERVLDLQFARRPGEDPRWHLYVEIIGKYSNVVLADAKQQIACVAHQVGSRQSSFRTVQIGQTYQPPPPLLGQAPRLDEPFARWQERLSLVPGALKKQLLAVYRGLSPAIATALSRAAGLDPQQDVAELSAADWQRLFQQWQHWLTSLEQEQFHPAWTADGYTVIGWQAIAPAASVQGLLAEYYTAQLNRQQFQNLRQQLQQKLQALQKKLGQKAQGFRDRLAQADDADQYRAQADLLMAYLHQWQPGMQSIQLTDFVTGEPAKIALNPERNAVQNAQALYKKHQKLRRAREAVQPLLAAVDGELQYLAQVSTSLTALDRYQHPSDLDALAEIRTELIEQGYFPTPREPTPTPTSESQPHRYRTPSGSEVWVGRNNRQNDQLSFRTATEYDLWFHAQEIPGSHVLLRLEPGAVAAASDLQFAANLAAYYSQGRESDRVPVVYTQPKYVYKPKGAAPGLAIYKHEQVLWGQATAIAPDTRLN